MKKGGFLRRALALMALAALLLACAAALVRSGLLEELGSVEGVRARIDAAGPMACLVFFLLQMLTVIVAPIPSNVTMAAGAMALGFWEATLLGLAAVVLGSVIVFAAGRALGREAVKKRLDGGVMEKYLPMIEEKQDMFLFLTMLFPFFPDDVLCILAGLTSMSFRRFTLIMVLSRPWGLIAAAGLGSGLVHAQDVLGAMPWWAVALGLAAMAAAFWLALRNAGRIERATQALMHGILRRFERNRDGKKAAARRARGRKGKDDHDASVVC